MGQGSQHIQRSTQPHNKQRAAHTHPWQLLQLLLLFAAAGEGASSMVLTVPHAWTARGSSSTSSTRRAACRMACVAVREARRRAVQIKQPCLLLLLL